MGQFAALLVSVLGLGGVIFTALRFNRDDTTAIVGQQSTVLASMKGLNDELRETSDRMRTERDELRGEVANLTGQIDALRRELRDAMARGDGPTP